MFRKLSVRIALLILVLGPTFVVVAVVLGTVYLRVAQPHTRIFLTLLELTGIGFGIPLVLGAVVSHFISESLEQFTLGAQRLRESSYSEKIPRGDIQEFDGLTKELNLLAHRLASEEELRRNLISDTSHELRTPLAALTGQIKGMKDGVLEFTPERLELLASQTDRLTHLVQDLQEYAQTRSRTVSLKCQDVSLTEVIHRMQDLYKKELAERHISLIDQTSTAMVHADPELFERLLSNLVHNAIRHSDGTKITIEALSGGFSVADNGKGIPQGALHHIFERFYLVDGSRSRETGGLGLGLAIAKEIVEAHGWLIKAESDITGTKFTICF